MMLNQTNIVDANNNKFIKAQVVSKAGSYHVHKRWGRVGSVGQMKTDGPFAAPEPAVKEFLKYFKSKSK